ncbi:hypothetical protein MUK42_36981 [Musa troglodytarum]|uniref:Uncharacterized protein n=1 Tax=Musa troglodytarum TaxID=320322 RepID=A0A9E7JB03_9LILI|nr:hypothetical protein MUK42_36981 [Musa troglodytarum]
MSEQPCTEKVSGEYPLDGSSFGASTSKVLDKQKLALSEAIHSAISRSRPIQHYEFISVDRVVFRPQRKAQEMGSHGVIFQAVVAEFKG